MIISLVLAQKMSWPWPVLCRDLGTVLWHTWVVPRLFVSRFELERKKFGLVVSIICMGPRHKHVDTSQPRPGQSGFCKIETLFMEDLTS